MILENRLKGLKARLESRISVDIENFLLVNILLRQIEQRLDQFIKLFWLISKNRPKGLEARLESVNTVDIHM